MSFIANGGAGILISPGDTHFWTFTWNSAGWQGNTFNMPQPLDPGATLAYTLESVTMNGNGTYSFSYSVSNTGPFATIYNLQTSSN